MNKLIEQLLNFLSKKKCNNCTINIDNIDYENYWVDITIEEERYTIKYSGNVFGLFDNKFEYGYGEENPSEIYNTPEEIVERLNQIVNIL